MDKTTSFNAGQQKDFVVRGDHFRIMDSTAPVTIHFYRDGAEIATAENVVEGYAEEFEQPFDSFTIISSDIQTLHFVARYGSTTRYDKAPVGDTNILNVAGPYANTRASVTSASVSTLLAAKPTRRYVFVQNNDSGVYLRLTCDGVDPTTTQGIRIAPGGYWESPAMWAPVGAIKAIAESGAGVAVEVMEG
jgi:hypothetical protein